MHLYRGSPCVRSWSRYQTTAQAWTLCGMHLNSGDKRERTECTGDPALVTCPYCRRLAELPGTVAELLQVQSASEVA